MTLGGFILHPGSTWQLQLRVFAPFRGKLLQHTLHLGGLEECMPAGELVGDLDWVLSPVELEKEELPHPSRREWPKSTGS